MLPHKLVAAISTWNNHDDKFWKLDNLRAACRQHLDNASKELGFGDNDRIIPIGFWHDGIPVKYDRSESLEVLTDDELSSCRRSLGIYVDSFDSPLQGARAEECQS